MSAYNFINEYFPGWNIINSKGLYGNHGTMIIQDGETKLRVHLNMNGASDWKDSDVTVSYVEAV